MESAIEFFPFFSAFFLSPGVRNWALGDSRLTRNWFRRRGEEERTKLYRGRHCTFNSSTSIDVAPGVYGHRVVQ